MTNKTEHVSHELALLAELDSVINRWVAEQEYGPGQPLKTADHNTIWAAITWLNARWGD